MTVSSKPYREFGTLTNLLFFQSNVAALFVKILFSERFCVHTQRQILAKNHNFNERYQNDNLLVQKTVEIYFSRKRILILSLLLQFYLFKSELRHINEVQTDEQVL